MARFFARHAVGLLLVAAVAAWALLYLPRTPAWAIYQLKRAIDARNGDAAAQYVDFPSVVRNAGYEMVKQNTDSGDLVGALVGQGAVDLLSRPMAAMVEVWARNEVSSGASEVQLPGAAVAGSIFLLHRTDDTAHTSFRDRKGNQWSITMAREDGQWRVTEVSGVRPLLEKLQQRKGAQ